MSADTTLLQLKTLVKEVIIHFAKRSDPKLRISVEIEAENAGSTGFDAQLERTIRENVRTLSFKAAEFE